MRTKEIKGDPGICPACGSDRVGSSDSIEFDDASCLKELRIGMFCLDCGDTYDVIFVPTGRLAVEV
jgi:hypothetical protein